ncbi:MAG: hypothetical protein J7M38_01805 [Armatimonadetes bacterium]|nr:hypothetical protein [Armatimonadota bacterium]
MIDMHNHIIRYVIPIHPSVEPDPEVAVRMAEIAAADGTRIIASTPHYREKHMSEDWLPRMAEGVARLNELLEERGVPVEVVGGAEVQMTEYLPRLAREGKLPTLGEGRHVLIELPVTSYALYAEQVLFELALQGYTPVLAHFERLASAPSNEFDPRALVERGYKLQVNCESLQGKRGREVTALARRLIREGLASCLGSDAHNADDKPPGLSACRREVEKLGGRGAFDRITWDEALAIIGR